MLTVNYGWLSQVFVVWNLSCYRAFNIKWSKCTLCRHQHYDNKGLLKKVLIMSNTIPLPEGIDCFPYQRNWHFWKSSRTNYLMVSKTAADTIRPVNYSDPRGWPLKLKTEKSKVTFRLAIDNFPLPSYDLRLVSRVAAWLLNLQYGEQTAAKKA